VEPHPEELRARRSDRYICCVRIKMRPSAYAAARQDSYKGRRSRRSWGGPAPGIALLASFMEGDPQCASLLYTLISSIGSSPGSSWPPESVNTRNLKVVFADWESSVAMVLT
jgi:hypothetical protein